MRQAHILLLSYSTLRDGKLKQTEQVEELRSKFEEQAREMENR